MFIKIVQHYYIITMKLKLTNENYSGTIVKIEKLNKLDNCDNVQAAVIMGNQVIISIDAKIGDIAVYFPVESKLSHKFLSDNNLYRNELMNNDYTKRGMFEDNGRVRCQKFRGHNSEGFLAPIEMFDIDLSKEIGKSFNSIDDVEIVEKYVKKEKIQQFEGKNRQKAKVKSNKIKIEDKQFEFHITTPMLYKNMHQLNLDDIIDISRKLHGTSAISSNILVYKKLNFKEKIVKFIGDKLGVINKYLEYKNIYSSRTVIKNNNPDAGFYGTDVWGEANEFLKNSLIPGMTIYYEIVGFIPKSGGYIQKGYDYGCKEKEFKIFIYRITHTDQNGHKIEYTTRQIEDWCIKNGFNHVPKMFKGTVRDWFRNYNYNINQETWRDDLLGYFKLEYLEKDCDLCNNKVPDEGVVVRIDGLDLKVFKLKSTRFLERETKELDSSEIDIESDN